MTGIYPRGSENIRKESEWFIDISNDRRFQYPLYTLDLACKGQGWRPLVAVFWRGAWKTCPPRRKRTWQCSSALLLQVLVYMHVYYNIEFGISPTKVILAGKPYISNSWSLSSFACHIF